MKLIHARHAAIITLVALMVTPAGSVASGAERHGLATVHPPTSGQVAPIITSSAAPTFQKARPASFTVSASGNPAPALTYVGSLPDGMTFTDNGNGTASIAGTPSGSSSGVITVTASNDVGLDDHQVLFLALACNHLGGQAPHTSAVIHISVHICAVEPSILTLEDLGLNYTCVLYQPCRFQYALVYGGPLVTTGKLPSGISPFSPASGSTEELSGTPDSPKDIGKTFALKLKTPVSPFFGYAAKSTVHLKILGPYLALGDSYSSGEANPPYVEYGGASDTDATGAGVSECHRSVSGSWSSIAAPLIAVPGSILPTYSYGGGGGKSRRNLACSGALIRHITGGWQDNAQYSQLSRIAKYKPSLVTLSIGGNSMVSDGTNDRGFSALIGVCVTPNLVTLAPKSDFRFGNLSRRFDCLPTHHTIYNPHNLKTTSCTSDGALDVADAVIKGTLRTFTSTTCTPVVFTTSLYERLTKVYDQVKDAVKNGDPKADPKAKIVVVGYPNISPTASIGDTWTCSALRDPTISSMLQTIANDLDETIAAAAAAAGVSYVSILATGQFTGHELCTGNASWLQPLDFSNVLLNDSLMQESAHPIAPGQVSMGNIVGPQVEQLIGTGP